MENDREWAEKHLFYPVRTVGNSQIDIGSTVKSFEFYGVNSGKTITVRIADNPLRTKADFETAKFTHQYVFVDNWIGFKPIDIEKLKATTE